MEVLVVFGLIIIIVMFNCCKECNGTDNVTKINVNGLSPTVDERYDERENE